MSATTQNFNPDNWDWFAFLDSSDDIKSLHFKEAKELALHWVTCACGQLCKELPRDENDMPMDDRLSDYGAWFNEFIHLENWVDAKNILLKIEKRASYLLSLPKTRTL